MRFPKMNPVVVVVLTIILAVVAVVAGLILFRARSDQFVPGKSSAASTPGWSISQVCNGFSVTAPEHAAFAAIADFGQINPNLWHDPQTFNQPAGPAGTFTYMYTAAPTAGATHVRIRVQINNVSVQDTEEPLVPCATPSSAPTPTPTLSPTPIACTVAFTISPTPTPGVTPSPTPTPTTVPTPTPTPNPTPGVTPQPTPTPISEPTPTPTTITFAPTPTPVTLEQAGSATQTWIISIAGAALLILGSSLFFVL